MIQFFVFASAAWLVSTAAAAAGRPNIVFILADDLGYGDLSSYGATKVSTPHIDRLATEGRLFSDAHSPHPVCTRSVRRQRKRRCPPGLAGPRGSSTTSFPFPLR